MTPDEQQRGKANMMSVEQIKAAREDLRKSDEWKESVSEQTEKLVFKAFSLLDAVLKQPTPAMVTAGNECQFPIVSDIWQAMRDQLLKEALGSEERSGECE